MDWDTTPEVITKLSNIYLMVRKNGKIVGFIIVAVMILSEVKVT